MTAPPASLRVVLDELQGDDASRRREEILQSLLEGGYSVTLTGEGGAVAPLDESPLVVLRDQPRETDVESETREGNVPVCYRGVEGLSAPEVVDLVRAEGTGRPDEAWKPWFPVIDYDRCTNCMQCLSFCLFGVYDVDAEKQIDVAHPDRCKTNCPACSRVCPEVAILFPKYKNGPINGDVVQAEDVDREKMKTDISSLLGGDIYALLRQRHEKASSRFSKERDEERALKERKRCLAKLQKELDIPAEVLSELPSAEDIQTRAAERFAARDPQTPEN